MSTLLFPSNNNVDNGFLWRPNVHFSTIVRQRTVAGGDKAEEKNTVQLLVKMNSKQRQEGRQRKEGERDVAGAASVFSEGYINLVFITSTFGLK